jgi:hypothetical protein
MATALKKRIAPGAPLTLTLRVQDGGKMTRNFNLCFDVNAIAHIETTSGKSVLRGEIWKHLNAANLRVMLWAAVLANHPEYDTKDGEGKRTDMGLEVIGSYCDADNIVAITEAVWEAYLASLSETKRKILEDGRKEAEAALPEDARTSEEGVPLVSAQASAPPAIEIGSKPGQSPDTTSASQTKRSAA